MFFVFSAIFHDQAMLQKCPENRLGDGVFGWDDIKDWVLKIQLSSCCCFVFLCAFFFAGTSLLCRFPKWQPLRLALSPNSDWIWGVVAMLQGWDR